MMSKALAPFLAAWVANPALKECPANSPGSNPARATAFLRIAPTESRCSPRLLTLPWRSISRKIAPSLIPAASIQSVSAVTGQVVRCAPFGCSFGNYMA
jgi:hypothetical protein